MYNSKPKSRIILLIILLLPTVLADGFGDCPFGEYNFGDVCITSLPQQEIQPSPSSGLKPDAQPALAEAIRTNQTPKCSEGNQYFEGACYPCSEGGVLFRKPNGQIGCVKCDGGAEYDGAGGCKKIVTPINKTSFNAIEIGSKLSPKNPYVGFALLLIPLIALLYWLYTRFEYAKKYEKIKKEKEKKEDEEEENPKV